MSFLDPPPDLRAWAGEALVEMAMAHPDRREDIVAAIMRELTACAGNSPILNADLCSFLAQLGATEREGVVSSAYAASAVDLSYGGTFAQWQRWVRESP